MPRTRVKNYMRNKNRRRAKSMEREIIRIADTAHTRAGAN